jgi:TolB-like protein
MAADIAAALDVDAYIEAQPPGGGSDASGDYTLNGSVYAEGQRAFVALQLVDAKTAKRVWSENYDYRGIGAESMAADIRKHLQTHASEN